MGSKYRILNLQFLKFQKEVKNLNSLFPVFALAFGL